MAFSFGAKSGALPPFTLPTFGAQTAQKPLFNAPTTASQTPNLFGASLSQQISAPFGNASNLLPPNSGASTGIMNSTIGMGVTNPTSVASPIASFGTNNAPKPSLFGTPTTLPVTSGISFGSRLGTVPNVGLGIGKPTAVTSDASNLNMGTTSTMGSLSFGLTGTTNAAPLVVPQPSLGLGGIPASTPSQGNVIMKVEQLTKEQPLPNELQQTVDAFKIFVKQQKSYSSDVARCSVKEFKKVESDIDDVTALLNDVEKELQANRNVVEQLKYDTAKGLQQIEMAQRTHDTPAGLQYENTSPLNFFIGLVDTFEREMQNMKLQIENTDKYVKNIGTPTPLNSQDLALGMRRIHDTFVALAGRLQSVHSQVQSHKDQYLNFRKYMLNDTANIFEKTLKVDDVLNVTLNTTYNPPNMTSGAGPTPFNSISHPSVVQATQSAKQQTVQTQGFGGSTLSGFGTQPTSFNLGTSSMSLFGNTSFGQPLNNQASTSFQLQKPPIGNKRGKQ